MLSAYSADRDPVRDLNNALQGHPTGNLTTQFSWVLKQTGPNHQITHFATAKCEFSAVSQTLYAELP
jgi:hypothetical protein